MQPISSRVPAPRLPLVLAAVAVVVVIVGALLATGAFSSSGSGGDPANAVPPSAARLRDGRPAPGGEAGDSVKHVLGHVAGDGDDPGPALRTSPTPSSAAWG